MTSIQMTFSSLVTSAIAEKFSRLGLVVAGLQMRSPDYRCGHQIADVVTGLQMWSPDYRCGRRITGVVARLQVWLLDCRCDHWVADVVPRLQTRFLAWSPGYRCGSGLVPRLEMCSQVAGVLYTSITAESPTG